MPDLDRDELLATLAKLADPDAGADAARRAVAMVGDAGLDWRDIIVDEQALAALAATGDTEPATDTPQQADQAASVADAALLIERLLERKNLYEGTRDELEAYKDDLASGDFDESDLAYLNALYARVMMGKNSSAG